MKLPSAIISSLVWAIMLFPCRLNAQSAASIMQKGIDYYKDKDYKNALAQYTLSLSIDQTNAKCYYNRGLTYEAMQNYNAAIGDYTAAIFYDPSMTLGYFHRGSCNFFLRKYADAIPDLTRSLPSNDPNNYSFRAQCYHRTGNLQAAIVDYSQAIAMKPDAFYYYSNRGDVFLDMGDYRRAVQDFNSAISLQPKSSTLFLNRGIANRFLGNFTAALADYSEAIRLQPNRYDLYFYRSALYDDRQQFDLALIDIDKAIEMQPGDPNGYQNRAMIYIRVGRYEEAVAGLRKTLQMDPMNGKAYINIVSPLVRLKQFSEAANYYRDYRQKGLTSHLRSENFEFYNHYMSAVEQVNLGNYPAAIAALETASKLYGRGFHLFAKRQFVDVLALQGYVLEKLGRDEDARVMIEKALAIDKLQPDLNETLQRIKQKNDLTSTQDSKGPEITILYPGSTPVITDQATIQVIGKAWDPSGISKISINNIPVSKVEEDGIFVSMTNIQPGSNSLIVAATDKKGNITTTSVNFSSERGLGKKENTGTLADANTARYYAILIAAKDYSDEAIPDLTNPVKDAKDLQQILETKYQFPAANIDTVFNNSREEIMQAIIQRCNALGPNDNLVIFYAGHGTAEKDRFGDVDGYWIPTSARKGELATYISAEDVNKALKRSRARHVLLIADACFSGAFTRQLPPDASREIQRQYAVPSRKVMASGNLEPVPDNSKFIYYLKKSLTENNEKYLSAKDLYDSFYKAILSNTENLPQYAAIKNVGDEGGEFIFIRK